MTHGITTFVTFKVPLEARDRYKEEWLKDAAFIAMQPGLKSGALYNRVGGDGHLQFVNVAHWESEDALHAARAAAIVQQSREGRDQASLFKDLGVTVGSENYVVDVPYQGPAAARD